MNNARVSPRERRHVCLGRFSRHRRDVIASRDAGKPNTEIACNDEYIPEFGLANSGHTSGVRIDATDSDGFFAGALRAAEDERERAGAMMGTDDTVYTRNRDVEKSRFVEESQRSESK